MEDNLNIISNPIDKVNLEYLMNRSQYKKYVSTDILKAVEQDGPYLLKELYDSGFRIYYNEYPHQASKNGISTCGRHCIVRSCFLDMDTDDYNDSMKMKKW